MNKTLLLERLIRGEPLEKTLFSPILMHFAARHAGQTYGAFAADHKVLVEANIKAMNDFGMDMVSLISDPYRETAAFGARIEFPAEEVPRCTGCVIKTPDDIHKLEVPDVYRNERTLDRIKGAEMYQHLLKGEVPVIGWIEGPLAEACDLAGVSDMLMMLMMDPESSEVLLDKCLEMAKNFSKAQLDAGCRIIGMGDAVCSQIDAGTYDTFVRDRHKEIISFVHEHGGLVKLHICGNITHLLPSISELHADIVDLDWQVGPGEARKILGEKVILCGNINPVLVQDLSAEEVYSQAKELVDSQKGQRFILSAGCEITVNTPADNLMAMRRASE
ncbi:MAG: uroporphyrinogen decarboxylase family protein [Bacteroidales bacterium]|nr:uroporphyrinogen decarboxylase family protein [Bacteroidales bacterium]